MILMMGLTNVDMLICIYMISILLYSVQTYPVENVRLSAENIVDLSYPFNGQTVYFPQFPFHNFQLTIHEKLSKDGDFYMRQGHFQAVEHGGTHIDSPSHFSRNGSNIADLTVNQLAGPAVVINVTSQVQSNPDYGLSVADITNFEAAHGRIPEGAFVFMYSEWGRRWPDREQVYGTDDLRDFSKCHFPGFAPEATQFLITQRNIRGVGVDGPSVDPASEARKSWGTHVLLAENGRVGMEYVANLEKLPPMGAKIIIAPMKSRFGSGAPARIWSVISRQ